MKIKMNALDTLFFRDGKPFSKGEENWSDGIFPPYPSVFYGALRSAFFSENIEIFHSLAKDDFNTKKDPTTKLKITNIALLISNEMVYPFPKDCLIEAGESSAVRIRSFENKNLSSSPTDFVLKTNEKKYETIKDGFISLNDFNKYLNNQKDRFTVKHLEIINEPKTGNGRNFETRRTDDDSMLYRVDMKRLGNVKIIIEFEGLEISESGFLKLGGEGKAVYYETYTENCEPIFPSIKEEFVMYISTPTFFKNGWLPDFINIDTHFGKIAGLDVKLISAIVDRPLSIGGYDMKKNYPKPMQKAVPAGSVYFFKILKGDPESLKNLQGKSISSQKQKEGFGIVYFGKTTMEFSR